MENTNKNTNTTGSILLVSYRDSEFIRLAEKNKGAYILDGRAKGWSNEKELRTEALKKRFGKRYVLMPTLAVVAGESPEDFIKKSASAIDRIIEVAEGGKSIIVTGFNSGLLKCIGHMLMGISPELKVFLRWENIEDSGISRQRPMKNEEFQQRLAKICESLETFSAKNDDTDFDEEAFSVL